MTPAESAERIRPVEKNATGPVPSREPPPWDADEPFLRMARHYLRVASAANSLCASQGGQGIGKGLAQFAQEWPNLKRGWESSRDRMTADATAARVCRDYLYLTSEFVRGATAAADVIPLLRASR